MKAKFKFFIFFLSIGLNKEDGFELDSENFILADEKVAYVSRELSVLV